MTFPDMLLFSIIHQTPHKFRDSFLALTIDMISHKLHYFKKINLLHLIQVFSDTDFLVSYLRICP